jgi:hypothetical protein
MNRYPMYRRLGVPQGLSGRMRKISSLPEFDPPTVQPVASPYIPAELPRHTRLTYTTKNDLSTDTILVEQRRHQTKIHKT